MKRILITVLVLLLARPVRAQQIICGQTPGPHPGTTICQPYTPPTAKRIAIVGAVIVGVGMVYLLVRKHKRRSHPPAPPRLLTEEDIVFKKGEK
jgi:hypothetical protein